MTTPTRTQLEALIREHIADGLSYAEAIEKVATLFEMTETELKSLITKTKSK